MNHDSMIEVIAAHRDGKEIDARMKIDGGLWNACSNPRWDFDECEYRINPTPAPPKPREFWIQFQNPGMESAQPCTISSKQIPNGVHVIEVLPSKGEEFKITLNQSVLMWLGQWRDKMPAEAVSELQEVLNVPKKT